MLIKPGVYPSEDSAVRRLERVYEEYTVIQRNIFGCYDVIGLLLTKSLITANGWNIYSLIF